MSWPKIYLAAFPYPAMRECDVLGQALAEDGTGLASHLSSNRAWARHDMGLNSDLKHDIYAKHCPNGYELIWVDDPANHEGWQAALALNIQRHVQATEATA